MSYTITTQRSPTLLSHFTISNRIARIARCNFQRIARSAIAGAVLTGGIQAALAQTTDEPQTARIESATDQIPSWHFLVASGTLIPTGTQRGDIQRANLTAAQLLYVVRPDFAVVATLGWARSRDAAEQRLDIVSYDVGIEARPTQWVFGNGVTLSPFVGAGLGARSYNARNSNTDASHRLAAYLSAGGELGIRRVHLRLEVRDYVSGSNSAGAAASGGSAGDQGAGGSRNDVVAMLGLYLTGQ